MHTNASGEISELEENKIMISNLLSFIYYTAIF